MGECPNEFTEEQVLSIIKEFGEVSKINQDSYLLKYKRFRFNQKLDNNPYMRWCPHCSKQRSMSMKSNGSDFNQGNNIKIDQEFADMENQVIYTDGYMRVND